MKANFSLYDLLDDVTIKNRALKRKLGLISIYLLGAIVILLQLRSIL